MNTRIRIFLLFSLLAGPVGAEDLSNLTYLTNEFPPNAYMEGGVLKGAVVEVLQELWKTAGVPNQPIRLEPFARGLQIAQTTKNAVLFAVSRTPAREELYRWVGPLTRGQVALMVPQKSGLIKKQGLDTATLRIGVIRQDVAEGLMLSRGHPDTQLLRVAKAMQLVELLNSGRIDAVAINPATLRREIDAAGMDTAQFEVLSILQEVVAYFAVNKDTDPTLVQMLQTALSRIEPQRVQIMKKYGVSP